MAVEVDASPEFAGYAHPERLVTGEWLEAHIGTPGLVIVESDEDVLLHETGHIATAVGSPLATYASRSAGEGTPKLTVVVAASATR